jgi:hypothetical protein
MKFKIVLLLFIGCTLNCNTFAGTKDSENPEGQKHPDMSWWQ